MITKTAVQTDFQRWWTSIRPGILQNTRHCVWKGNGFRLVLRI